MELLRTTRGREARVALSFAAAYCLGRQGRTGEALVVARGAHVEHHGLAAPIEWKRWHHAWTECEALSVSGRYSDADGLAGKQYRRSLADGDLEARAFFGRHLAANATWAGRLEVAIHLGRESVSLFKQISSPNHVAWASPVLSTALALRGDFAEAELVLERGLADVDRTFGDRPEVLESKAWIFVSRGELSEARLLLGEAVRRARASGDRVTEASAPHDLARLGEAAEVVEDLEIVATLIDGDFTGLRAEHARALAGGDAVALLRSSADFDLRGSHLLAAEAALDAAVCFRKLGDRRKSSMAERRGMNQARRCDGARTPALSRVEPRVCLTPAELDTARLAARGHTNREIAVLQHLSIRTVQNRLRGQAIKRGRCSEWVPSRERIARWLLGPL